MFINVSMYYITLHKDRDKAVYTSQNYYLPDLSAVDNNGHPDVVRSEMFRELPP